MLGLGAVAASGRTERRLVVFYTGGVQGTLEPCGCTSDPLGDVARMTALVRRAQKGGAAVLLVDGGNLSYPADGIPARRAEAADLKAAFLARELGKLPFGGSALGETDLARGPAKVQPKRLAANIAGAPFVEPSRVRDVGGVKVGIFGLSDPHTVGLKAEVPAVAARREAEALRKAGAEVVIALAALDRPTARQVARSAPIDFIVVGKGVDDGLPAAERVGDAYLVAAAVELQKVGRLEIVLRDGRLVDAGGPETTRLRSEEIARKLVDLDAQLAAWAKDGTADPAFVAGKRKERDELEGERKRLAASTWQPPATGSYFTNQLVPLRRVLPRDPTLAGAMRSLDKAIGRANLRHAEPPPRAEPGRAAFVGDRACVRCHKEEQAFWTKTVHAHAWTTLVKDKKEAHDDCVSCHVTGYGEVGGSSLGYTRRLEAVQCEVCHGPGSAHVAAEGLEEPPAVRLSTPSSTCVRCHNEKHSDTFQYEAYMRDILGPGHGAEARAKLGPGPTGRQLRSAAITKARAAAAAQIK